MKKIPQPTAIHLSYGPETLQFGELFLPSTQDTQQLYPVVILIHGGFWRNPYDYTLMTSLAKDLAQRGSAAWNIEYRRIGDKGGGWPGTLLDVALATDYIRTIAPTYQLDLNRIVTVGHSAGGHLALWLAARPKIAKASPLAGSSRSDAPLPLRGAISLAGVNDLELCSQLHLGNDAASELLGGTFDEVPERYVAASPAAMLPLGIPQVLVHGTKDESVPITMSQVYFAAAQAAGDPMRLITLPDEDHFVVINVKSQAWQQIVEAIEVLLTKM